MSQIKLVHSGGNGVIISAPSSNPAANRTITLPGNADGEMLTTNNPKTGNIIQVVSTIKTNVFTSYQNAGVEVEITGLNATITPSSSSNKILLSFHVQTSQSGTTYGLYPKRDSTIIFIGDADGFRQRVTIPTGIPKDGNQMNSMSFTGVDSPATTSAVTYKIFAISDGGTLRVNRAESDANGSTGKRTVSSITLMEVAG